MNLVTKYEIGKEFSSVHSRFLLFVDSKKTGDSIDPNELLSFECNGGAPGNLKHHVELFFERTKRGLFSVYVSCPGLFDKLSLDAFLGPGGHSLNFQPTESQNSGC